LQNRGVDYFCREIYPELLPTGGTFIVNVSGSSPEDYAECAARVDALEQIPAIEEYRKYKVYYKNYTSLEGKSKKKYGENCRYELDQYHECRKKLKELFPTVSFPKSKTCRTN
jgi:hypothetical protein